MKSRYFIGVCRHLTRHRRKARPVQQARVLAQYVNHARIQICLRENLLRGQLKPTSGHKCEILKYTNASGR